MMNKFSIPLTLIPIQPGVVQQRSRLSGNMSVCAGPGTILGTCRQAGLQRLSFDITGYGPEIFLSFDNTGEKAVLPYTAGLTQFPVEVLSINLVGKADSSCQRGFHLRHSKKVAVIVHEAIGPDLKTMLFGIFFQSCQIGSPVFIIKKTVERLLPRWVTW